jgi:hypothetical protein
LQSGVKESAQNARLLSWLERIIEKQRKKNELRSTDVLEVETKFKKHGSGLQSMLNPGVAAAAVIHDYNPE